MRCVFAAAVILVLSLGSSVLTQDNPPQPKGRPPVPMTSPPMNPPTATMVVHKDYLFICLGATLYKVDPDQMKVVGELQIRKQPTDSNKD